VKCSVTRTYLEKNEISSGSQLTTQKLKRRVSIQIKTVLNRTLLLASYLASGRANHHHHQQQQQEQHFIDGSYQSTSRQETLKNPQQTSLKTTSKTMMCDRIIATLTAVLMLAVGVVHGERPGEMFCHSGYIVDMNRIQEGKVLCSLTGCIITNP